MSDNVSVTAGSGTSVATDDIGGVQYQRVKLGLGPDGTANDAIAGSGVNGVGVQRVTIATDDQVNTGIGSLTETAPTTDIASSGLNGRLQRLAQRLTTLIAQHPSALGSTAAASSMAVTASTEDIARVGAITETAPATDTASSGLNGRLQRIAQRLTSQIALMPASLGSKAAASSLAITQSTEDAAQLGSLTETAPTTDTASSGLNGRLQRIAQRVTSLIALLPTAIGRTTSAGSLSVVHASDDALMGIVTETAPASDTASSGVNGRLQRIAQNLTTLNTSLTAANTQLPTTPSGSVTVSITRPANQTAYTAGDLVGGAITFATGLTSGQRGMITSVDLMPQIGAVPSGMTSFFLHLYSVTPPSAAADNNLWDIPSGDRASYLGYVSVGTPVDVGSTLYCQTDAVNRPFQLSGSANLFGYLVTTGGYTPAANSEVYQIRLHFLGL